ncbi:antibiotic biosynthesis monooxygenase family protein [Emcibacter sp.]|uniref:antibiotic biosynthesis monooxygenase family protein n=1 Tax=Emcibacter sp. TaxID=1979954 RepID=UPI003A907859
MPPKPPYYAVIFTSRRSLEDDEGYAKMAEAMEEQARKQPGFLGIESARDPETRFGITVSYWKNEDSVKDWKEVTSHKLAQKLGREKWYESYTTHVAKVERSYGFGDEG